MTMEISTALLMVVWLEVVVLFVTVVIAPA